MSCKRRIIPHRAAPHPALPGNTPFDSLAPTLSSRVDEVAIPAEVGFTATPPTGWTVDISRMGTGGMTEWRGWTFATDRFWSAAQRDQGRELFVRGCGVFAVADSDERADKAVTGTFDSTLVSPKYPGAGGRPATLTFAHDYQQYGATLTELPRKYAQVGDLVAAT